MSVVRSGLFYRCELLWRGFFTVYRPLVATSEKTVLFFFRKKRRMLPRWSVK